MCSPMGLIVGLLKLRGLVVDTRLRWINVAITQMHNSCLLYWVSPKEYNRVFTLCDLKFCRYHSPCAWILLCSRPLTGSGVVKDLVFRRYMAVAQPCIRYRELCYVERLPLDFDVDCKV